MDTSRKYTYICFIVMCKYELIRINTEESCALMQQGGKSGLVFRGERQQYVAGHAAISRIPRIDEDHAADNDRAGSVEGTALGLDSIYGGVFLHGIEIPENFAVFGRERAQMSIERAGEDDAGDQRERLRLGWAATGPRRIAWMARGEPGLPAVFEMQGGQTAAFRGIKRGSTNRPRGIHHGGNVGNRGVHFLAIAGHAPLHASVEAPGPDARLPEDFSLCVRIECVDDAGLLPGDEDFATLRPVHQQRG